MTAFPSQPGEDVFISCPGNAQLNPLGGGFFPSHGMPVFIQKKPCRGKKGTFFADCGICVLRVFLKGDFWARYGLTRAQVRALFPGGAVDGSGIPI